MRTPCLSLGLGLWVLSVLVDTTTQGGLNSGRFRKESPLPVFTRVEMKHNVDRHSITISVYYDANERPDDRWFVDDVPFVGGMGDYFMANHYMLHVARVILPDDIGRRFAVCLQTPDAQNCLHLRPLPKEFREKNEDVDFPWPLLVPAPQARYKSGENVKIFAPVLHTYYFAYSGRFIYLEPSQAHQSASLKLAEFDKTDGGEEGNVITMRPVTSGSPGWVVELATSVKEVEGLLLFQTSSKPPPRPSRIVERCVSTRPIHIHNKDHPAPFPDNFVAMLPHQGLALPVACRQQSQLFCLIACPFIINGDIREAELNLSRVVMSASRRHVVPLPRTSLFATAKRSGKYVAEAVFQLNVSDDAEPGYYQCSVTLNGTTTSTLVELTIV